MPDDAAWRPPLGATPVPEGTLFAVHSRTADAIDVVLFDDPGDHEPSRFVTLDQRSGAVHHAFVPGVQVGQAYGLRAHGAWEPATGDRFNPHKVLLDPYAKELARHAIWHDTVYDYDRRHPAHRDERSNAAYAPLGRVTSPVGRPAGTDPRPMGPRVPWPDTVLYEAHVKGATATHEAVPPECRGTYRGLASPPMIEHLRSLHVTSVVLMPVQAFVTEPHLAVKGLTNYWGYNTLSFFAPEPRYASTGIVGAADELRAAIDTLHREGFEVLLDVVYNHTCEGGRTGPTFSFRGLDARGYYAFDPRHGDRYLDYAGTGNILHAGAPAVVTMIADSLRHWVQAYGVDGFRFDLAPVLGRARGDFDPAAPLLTVMEQDPVLRGVKWIAEPWDVGPHGYQFGNFPWPWAEWNDKFRDGVRRYWRGDRGSVPELATRLAGSADPFLSQGKPPWASINYVTSHDGFTLHDLVSYGRKHNEANHEGNRDGHGDESSQNFGVEGPSTDPQVTERRAIAKRSLIATLALADGVPMLSGGDENGRTQRGNNNAYCQDGPLAWTPWDLSDEDEAFLAFVREAFALRARSTVLRAARHRTGASHHGRPKDISWWHPAGRAMTVDDWSDHDMTTLGVVFGAVGDGRGAGDDALLALFQGRRPVPFRLPPIPGVTSWTLELSTVRPGRRRDYGVHDTVRPDVDGVVVLRARVGEPEPVGR